MKVFITGGAGFIGCNAAARFIKQGHDVTVYDNLSRPGTASNLKWLQGFGRFKFVKGDIRDRRRIEKAVAGARGLGAVLHYAGQVAVTTSVVDPREDFEINALGTFNVLEAVRKAQPKGAGARIALLYSSTNKVYGGMEDIRIVEKGGRYQYRDFKRGIPEDRLLDFHSPYGCSKGAADQYVLDYARTFHMPAVVFRMSCIYGPHQFGTEDQGWLAHFLIRAMKGQAITIYGDGLQVRDVLFVEDLVRAFLLARDRIDTISGQAFNMGGGATRTTSLVELIELIAQLEGRAVQLQFDAWREADQRYYVSNTSRFQEATGWKPRVSVEDGVRALHRWLQTMQAPAQVQVPAVTATVAG